jgi:precorrin-3B methylase
VAAASTGVASVAAASGAVAVSVVPGVSGVPALAASVVFGSSTVKSLISLVDKLPPPENHERPGADPGSVRGLRASSVSDRSG